MNLRSCIFLLFTLFVISSLKAQDQKMFEVSLRLGPHTVYENDREDVNAFSDINGKIEFLYNINSRMAVGIDYINLPTRAFDVAGNSGAAFATFSMLGSIQGVGANFKYYFTPNSKLKLYGLLNIHQAFLSFDDPFIEPGGGATINPNYSLIVDQFESKNTITVGLGVGANFFFNRVIGLTASFEILDLNDGFKDIPMVSDSQEIIFTNNGTGPVTAELFAGPNVSDDLFAYYLGVVFKFGNKKI